MQRREDHGSQRGCQDSSQAGGPGFKSLVGYLPFDSVFQKCSKSPHVISRRVAHRARADALNLAQSVDRTYPGLRTITFSNPPINIFVPATKIRGRTRGIGNEFVLACDMRFASPQGALFGNPEVGVGLVPGGGALEWLPRLVGRSRALEIVLSGDDFDADVAERFELNFGRYLPEFGRATKKRMRSPSVRRLVSDPFHSRPQDTLARRLLRERDRSHACPNRLADAFTDRRSTWTLHFPLSCVRVPFDRSHVQGRSVIVSSARPTNRASISI